jgi:hypothetical protein
MLRMCLTTKLFTPIELEILTITLELPWHVLRVPATTFSAIREETTLSVVSVEHTTLLLPEPIMKPCCASVQLGMHVRLPQWQIQPNLLTIVGDAD